MNNNKNSIIDNNIIYFIKLRSYYNHKFLISSYYNHKILKLGEKRYISNYRYLRKYLKKN
jgi:hypothetical protein